MIDRSKKGEAYVVLSLWLSMVTLGVAARVNCGGSDIGCARGMAVLRASRRTSDGNRPGGDRRRRWRCVNPNRSLLFPVQSPPLSATGRQVVLRLVARDGLTFR